MDNFNITPKDNSSNNINKQEKKIKRVNSIIFNNAQITSSYLEITSNDNQSKK